MNCPFFFSVSFCKLNRNFIHLNIFQKVYIYKYKILIAIVVIKKIIKAYKSNIIELLSHFFIEQYEINNICC